MNEATKTKWANILTAVGAIIAMVQGFLTSPPFPTETLFVVGAILTYTTLVTTAWKQYLSPEVSNTGTTVTIWIAIVATVAGLGDLLHIFNFPTAAEQYIKWGITVLASVLSILSKQLFPSELQKDKMLELKKINN